MKNFLSFLTIFLLLFVILAPKAFAANLSVALPPAVDVGENFEVLINADTDGVPINSVNIILDYDQDLMSFSGYKEEGAVIGLWVDPPHEKNGAVYMSGVIPGGVSGLYDPNERGLGAIPLARLLFTAKVSGQASFSFIKTEIFKNDGKGTELAHEKKGGQVIIKNNLAPDGDKGKEAVALDQEQPEPFQLVFLDSSIFGKTPPMLIFKGSDAGSGIKEYKINVGGSIWKNAKSPQTIGKGIFPRDVTVRAFDFFGNFQDSSIRIPGFLSPQALAVVIVLLTTACIVGYKMLKFQA